MKLPSLHIIDQIGNRQIDDREIDHQNPCCNAQESEQH